MARVRKETAVSRRIRELRDSTGLTQIEFAATIGVRTPATISRWENGHTTPYLSEAITMGRVYGRSLDWFAGVDEAPLKRLADLSVGIQTRVGRIEQHLESLMAELGAALKEQSSLAGVPGSIGAVDRGEVDATEGADRLRESAAREEPGDVSGENG
jgi:transcriptional regulator with XRE-family HTH domain